MKTKDNDYFIDSDKLYDFMPDSLLATDEWDILRYKIEREMLLLKDDTIKEYYMQQGIPFLYNFRFFLEKKLVENGYKQEHLRNMSWLKTEAYSRRKDYDNPELEAAMAALVCIDKMKDLFIIDGKLDRNAINIFLHSLEMIINVFRAGALPELARTEVKTILGGEKGGMQSGKTRKAGAKEKHALWQKEAEKIWKRRPTLNNTDVAKIISKNKGGNVGTIRKSIKKPLS